MDSEKNIIGKCPVCGSDVIKTLKGYACVNSLQDNPTCDFFLFSSVGNRRLSDCEAKTFLADKRILLDGFATKDGKCFTSVLSFTQDGTVNMSSQIGMCPRCHGLLYINSRGISCGNYKDQEHPCSFTLWRNVGGHELSLKEIEEIINNGSTTDAITLYDIYGSKTSRKIGLNAEKEVVRL